MFPETLEPLMVTLPPRLAMPQAELSQQYQGWDVWYVRSINPRPFTTWHARPKGHPVATVHADSPEALAAEISEQEIAP